MISICVAERDAEGPPSYIAFPRPGLVNGVRLRQRQREGAQTGEEAAAPSHSLTGLFAKPGTVNATPTHRPQNSEEGDIPLSLSQMATEGL